MSREWVKDKHGRIDCVATNAIARGAPNDVMRKYFEARDLLEGTGFQIGNKHFATEAPWAKPVCPHGCHHFVNGMDERAEDGRPFWQCWGCGETLVSTERQKDWSPPDMPEWMRGR